MSVVPDYRIMYRVINGEWNEFDTTAGQQIVFEQLTDAEVIVQHLVSMTGVIEGVVIDQDDNVLQQWKAGPGDSVAQLVDGAVAEPASLRPN